MLSENPKKNYAQRTHRPFYNLVAETTKVPRRSGRMSFPRPTQVFSGHFETG
jgi:hypothetical protein